MRSGSGPVRPDPLVMLALPIFPVRLQTSIVGRIELNFRVRDGNGWTLDLINTNYHYQVSPATNLIVRHLSSFVKKNLPQWFLTRTIFLKKNGDPYGNRTHVCGVRGRRLNRLTNGPFPRFSISKLFPEF